MNSVLKEIFENEVVQDADGQRRPVHSHTDRKQGELIFDTIRNIEPTCTLEIGLAYGISTLFILDALDGIQLENHIVIEPYPDVYWDNIGLLNIQRAGYKDRIELKKDFSYNVLPELYAKGQRIQFAYIDSTKLYDVISTDIFYILKMLSVGGVLVLDDVSYPSIRKIARFLKTLPFLEVYWSYKPDKLSLKKKIGLSLATVLLNLVPFKKFLFRDQDIRPDDKNGIHYHAMAFRKTSEDKRQWNWFTKF